MKLERTKNAGRNILFGIVLKLYQVVVPFILRTAMIYYMGVEYLGLNSLFTSILQVLSLTELGMGGAMVYSMYKPIAEDDKTTFCALLNLYKKSYRIIGCVIGGVGLIITPLIPHLIKVDTVPSELNIYVLYLLNLLSTVLSYLTFAYKSSVLNAYQRTDIISKVTLITNTIQYILQLYIVIFLKDYYLFYIVLICCQLLNNLISAWFVNKMYPELRPVGELPISEKKKIGNSIKDLFTARIGAVIVNSVDTIVISFFLGLTVLAIYQNYFYILNSIVGFITVVFNACLAGIGNSIIVETKEKNYHDLEKFTFIIVWIAGFCAICLLCLYQPFMEIWVGKEYMLEFSAVICFVVYFVVYEFNQLLNIYKDAAGIWHKDRFRPLVTALTNLVLNLLMVQYIGIYGVLLSTVISATCIGMPWIVRNLFTTIFDKKDMRKYVKKLLGYVGIIAGSGVITYFCCSVIEGSLFFVLIVRGILCCIIPNIIFWIFLHNRVEFKECILLVKKFIPKIEKRN